jgi:hypothetical protein
MANREMAELAGSLDSGFELDTLLARAIQALAVLDAEAIEVLAESLAANGGTRLPCSPAEWARARSQHWVLGHLLGATADRLAMLRRVSALPRFGAYGGEMRQEISRLAAGRVPVPPN